MKKIVCMVLCVFMLLSFIGCSIEETNSANINLEQLMTIVIMPSPPKCKTTGDTAKINKVMNVLSEIEKAPTDNDDDINGWFFMIKLSVDGKTFTYTVGNVFTDSNGTQYTVKNYDEIKDKLTEIYTEIDAEETDYI